MTSILGISAFYHDSAAALVVDGEIVAAAQEERFTRKKYDEEFPVRAAEYCLQHAGIAAGDLDYVAFYDKPFRKFQRLLDTYLAYAPSGFRSFSKAIPIWLDKKLHLTREMRDGLNGAYGKRFVYTEHHESHAASAFFPSPFDEAAILTLDGVGEWATATIGYGRGNKITLTHEQRFPHSLGLLYSAFTYYCGFAVNSGEYKLMGLAPYGRPRYADLIIERMLDLKEDGSFRMDMSCFNYCQGLTMTSARFHDLFGGPPRVPETPLTERDMDIAASIQHVTEEIILRSARHVHRQTGIKKLCMAGGVALNCVANGRIVREGPFDDIWVQPAAGDAGGALGAALFVWHQLLGRPRVTSRRDSQHGSLLGPSYTPKELETYLRSVDAQFERYDDDEGLASAVAREIAGGGAVGWFQGRMEFGPRALGSRSILGDARNAATQTTLNVKVKFREGFRPFAPAVLEEDVSQYFGMQAGTDSPYMLLVAPVLDTRRKELSGEDGARTGIAKLKIVRSDIPAVTHVDYSARVQTVDRERHGLYRTLLEHFYRQTGCSVLVNTSFNLGWDPIVCTPDDAYRTFMSCDLDVLCMGPFVVRKRQQRAWVTDPASPAMLEEVACCPCGSGSPLQQAGTRMVAQACGHQFPIDDGIPQLYWPHDTAGNPDDVTERVKAFYEETPFPNYDEHESVRSLIEKSRNGRYARALDRAIPHNSTVLEVGCGTGQLTNFLGIGLRRVIGADLCLNSLKLGERFRREQQLARVRFVQVNLFRAPFRRGQFDVVLCNGVLHHTSDPRGGFASLVPLVKPGGHIVIGLYNRFGRIGMNARGVLFRTAKGRAKWLDPHLRSQKMSAGKRRAWFADQYLHPHESTHTAAEILEWFEQEGVEFVRGVPSVVSTADEDMTRLFQPTSPGTAWTRFITQARQVVTGNREGGFFIMIGRVPASTAAGASQVLERERQEAAAPAALSAQG